MKRKFSLSKLTLIILLSLIGVVGISLLIPWAITPKISEEFEPYETKIIPLASKHKYVKFPTQFSIIDVGFHTTTPTSAYMVDHLDLILLNFSSIENFDAYCLNGSILSVWWGNPANVSVLPNVTGGLELVNNSTTATNGSLEYHIHEEALYTVNFSDLNTSESSFHLMITRQMPSFDTVDSTHEEIISIEDKQFAVHDYSHLTITNRASTPNTIEFRMRWVKWKELYIVFAYFGFSMVCIIPMRIVKKWEVSHKSN